MEDRFHDVLSSVKRETGPLAFGALWRIRGRVAAPGVHVWDITALLADKCRFKTSKSAVSRLVRAQARRRRNAGHQISRRVPIPPRSLPKKRDCILGPHSVKTKSSKESQAMKAHKPAITLSDNDFYFDPTEPLRLINPGKRESNE